jgi:hypothetical protein
MCRSLRSFYRQSACCASRADSGPAFQRRYREPAHHRLGRVTSGIRGLPVAGSSFYTSNQPSRAQDTFEAIWSRDPATARKQSRTEDGSARFCRLAVPFLHRAQPGRAWRQRTTLRRAGRTSGPVQRSSRRSSDSRLLRQLPQVRRSSSLPRVPRHRRPDSRGSDRLALLPASWCSAWQSGGSGRCSTRQGTSAHAGRDRDRAPASKENRKHHGQTDGVPTEIRTLVTAVKGRCPGPLDDGDVGAPV